MASVTVDAAPRGCRGRQVCLEAMIALDIDHDDVLQSRVLRYLSFIDELQVRSEYLRRKHFIRCALGAQRSRNSCTPLLSRHSLSFHREHRLCWVLYVLWTKPQPGFASLFVTLPEPSFGSRSTHNMHFYATRTYILICASKSIVQPARCTTFVFFGLAFPAKNRLSEVVVHNFVHALGMPICTCCPADASLAPSLEMANFQTSMQAGCCRVCWCTFSRLLINNNNAIDQPRASWFIVLFREMSYGGTATRVRTYHSAPKYKHIFYITIQ